MEKATGEAAREAEKKSEHRTTTIDEKNEEKKIQPLSISQKILRFFTWGVLISIILFTTLVALDKYGLEAHQQCMAETCASKGEEYCQGEREIEKVFTACCTRTGGSARWNRITNIKECSFEYTL